MRLSERGMINNCNIYWFLFSVFITVATVFNCLGWDAWSPPPGLTSSHVAVRPHWPPGTDSHIPTGMTQNEHSSRRSSAHVDLIPPTQRFPRRSFPEENTGRLKIRRWSESECVCVCVCVCVPACVCGCCWSVGQWCWRRTGGWYHRGPSRCCQKVDLEAQEISGAFETRVKAWSD